MSLSFPNFQPPNCMNWSFDKRRKYSTIQQTPQSKAHPASATLQTSVIFELELTYDFLKNKGTTYADDAEYIGAFYEACRGGFGWFTFDPSQYQLDNGAVVHDITQLRNGYFGIGDGVTTTFPLWRSSSVFGGGVVTQLEKLQSITLFNGIYANGVVIPVSTQTNFPAQVTFTTPPAVGAVLSWDGSYRYLCKFSEDLLDMSEFMYQLWELKSLKLDTIIL